MPKQVVIKETKVVSTEVGAVFLDKTEAEAAIQQFNEAKRVIKAMEQQKSEAEAVLRELMGQATVGLIDGVERVKISTRNTKDVDKKKLQEVYPEAYEGSLKFGSYTVVTAVS